jgi:hypothetical protein
MTSPRRIGPSTVSTLTALTVLAALPRVASAQQVVASDCNLDFKDVYNKGDAVCVTGDLDYVPPNKIFAEAYLFVIPVDHPNPFADVTGSPNYIIGNLGGGGYIDEYVWLPPLKAGQYEFVIDNYPFFIDQMSPFDPGKDLRTGYAFSVSNAPIVYSVDPTKIKAEAVKGLEEALAIMILSKYLTAVDAISTVVDWSMALGKWGGLAAGALGIYCISQMKDCPTSYNSAVITIGTKLLDGIADALFKKYLAIVNDPPDPNFAQPVALDLDEVKALGFPATPLAEHPFSRGQTQFANLIALQSAAYLALVPSLEKLQGAQQANNNLGMLIHAEKVKQYAELAIAAGDQLVAEADAFQAFLNGAGIADVGYDMAEFNANLQAFKDAGFSDGDKTFLYSYGLSDAEIAAAAEQIKVWEPTKDNLTHGAIAQRVRQSFLVFKPALEDLVTQAENIRAENDAAVLRPGPKLTVAKPAAATVGVPVQVGASAVHFDPAATLTYAWDLDLDGEFDDGDGAQVMYTPTAPGMMMVSAWVSDGKNIDYGYAFVDVSIGNAPPEITALTPAETSPFAAVGDVIGLHAEASDADGDPVTLSWTVDGNPAGMGTDLEFVMPDEEAHWISLVVADDDPYSPDIRVGRVIRAKKWESMVPDDTTGGDSDTTGGTDPTGGSEGTGGTGGGTSDSGEPTGGGSDGSATGGSATGGSAGTDGSTDSAGTGGGSATGGSNTEGGCGCNSGPGGGGLLALLLLGWRRRRST